MIVMFTFVKKVKNEAMKSKEEFDMFIKKNEEFNNEILAQMLDQLCQNAYTLGRIGEEIDYSKDLYVKMSAQDRVMIEMSWIKGCMDTLIKKLEKDSASK